MVYRKANSPTELLRFSGQFVSYSQGLRFCNKFTNGYYFLSKRLVMFPKISCDQGNNPTSEFSHEMNL